MTLFPERSSLCLAMLWEGKRATVLMIPKIHHLHIKSVQKRKKNTFNCSVYRGKKGTVLMSQGPPRGPPPLMRQGPPRGPPPPQITMLASSLYFLRRPAGYPPMPLWFGKVFSIMCWTGVGTVDVKPTLLYCIVTYYCAQVYCIVYWSAVALRL